MAPLLETFTVLLMRLIPRGVKRYLRRRLRVLPARSQFTNLHLGSDVLVYFADSDVNLYQIKQWLKAFHRLDEEHRTIILTRTVRAYRALQPLTHLGLVLLRDFSDLDNFYGTSEFKVCLYVNNSLRNFHSLMYPNLLHVHLNHGESDKVSMASNQAKAYDYVLVAGQAAVDRYRSTLLKLDDDKLVRVGRPQLDGIEPRNAAPAPYPTVLYAPTWEGGRVAMDYSSLHVYGVELVERLLESERYRVLYKPHPMTGTQNDGVAAADEEIRRMIRDASRSQREHGHAVEADVDILSLFAESAVMISDISSVALDFLTTGRPLLLTDPRNDQQALEAASPAARSSYIVNAHTISQIPELVDEALGDDPKGQERLQTREYYFGRMEPGESTKRFIAAVDAIVAERDELIREKRNAAVPPAAVTPEVSAS